MPASPPHAAGRPCIINQRVLASEVVYFSFLMPLHHRVVLDFVVGCASGRSLFVALEHRCHCLVWASLPSPVNSPLAGYTLFEVLIDTRRGGTFPGCQNVIDLLFRSVRLSNKVTLNRLPYIINTCSKKNSEKKYISSVKKIFKTNSFCDLMKNNKETFDNIRQSEQKDFRDNLANDPIMQKAKKITNYRDLGPQCLHEGWLEGNHIKNEISNIKKKYHVAQIEIEQENFISVKNKRETDQNSKINLKPIEAYVNDMSTLESNKNKNDRKVSPSNAANIKQTSLIEKSLIESKENINSKVSKQNNSLEENNIKEKSSNEHDSTNIEKNALDHQGLLTNINDKDITVFKKLSKTTSDEENERFVNFEQSFADINTTKMPTETCSNLKSKGGGEESNTQLSLTNENEKEDVLFDNGMSSPEMKDLSSKILSTMRTKYDETLENVEEGKDSNLIKKEMNNLTKDLNNEQDFLLYISDENVTPVNLNIQKESSLGINIQKEINYRETNTGTCVILMNSDNNEANCEFDSDRNNESKNLSKSEIINELHLQQNSQTSIQKKVISSNIERSKELSNNDVHSKDNGTVSNASGSPFPLLSSSISIKCTSTSNTERLVSPQLISKMEDIEIRDQVWTPVHLSDFEPDNCNNTSNSTVAVNINIKLLQDWEKRLSSTIKKYLFENIF